MEAFLTLVIVLQIARQIAEAREKAAEGREQEEKKQREEKEEETNVSIYLFLEFAITYHSFFM